MQAHGGGCIIPFSIAFESELKAATDAGQRGEYLESVAPAVSSIPKMIRQVSQPVASARICSRNALVHSGDVDAAALCRATRIWISGTSSRQA